MRKNLKNGVVGAFETLLDAYLTDPKGFADGEAQILEECLYQIKINGGEPEVNQVLMDRSADELRAYYAGRERVLKMLKKL